MALRAGIALTYEKRDIIQGWEGQPKGMEQILWERGWINPMVTRKVYTVHGTKDSMGAVRKDTSLLYLMSNLKDFHGQETMLQLKATEMGIFIDRTPKCHCELAGEGIEYAWGCTKNRYQRQPLKDKRGKDNFHRTVRKCFSREVITTERVRLFSQRARAYILSYHKLRQEQLTESSSITDLDVVSISPVNIEKLLKRFKTHRCAMDFDSAFVRLYFAMTMDTILMGKMAAVLAALLHHDERSQSSSRGGRGHSSPLPPNPELKKLSYRNSSIKTSC
jgi:hypothetical protein